VTVVSRWLIDLAFAAPPQSGLAWFCFLFPLIEPDWQISRIRLSEKTHDVPCDAVCNCWTQTVGWLDSSSIPMSFVASCVRL